MKNLVIFLTVGFALALGAVAFWYGSASSLKPAASPNPVDASFSRSLPPTQHPAYDPPSSVVGNNEKPAPSVAALLSGQPSRARPMSAADTGRLPSASAPIAQDDNSIHAGPSSRDKAFAAARDPNGLLKQRKLGPLGVAVPLAFQDVDLFINTPQGLRYAPVDFNPASGAAAGAGASSTNATPTPGSPGTITIDETSAATLEKMREDFVNQVGGLGQDANDPEYTKRWRNAQQLSDSWFRFQFGWQAFNSYQLAAATKAEAERQAAKQ